jgi:hypothetical protein
MAIPYGGSTNKLSGILGEDWTNLHGSGCDAFVYQDWSSLRSCTSLTLTAYGVGGKTAGCRGKGEIFASHPVLFPNDLDEVFAPYECIHLRFKVV